MKSRPVNHSVTCYASPRKALTREVLEAFAAGWPGARIVDDCRFRGGPSAFYGIKEDLTGVWKEAQASGFCYIDRGYFRRETHWRVTRNALQCDGSGEPDHDRLSRLGVRIEPWRPEGRHVLVCPQSDWWHRLHCGVSADEWTNGVVSGLRIFTDRPVKVRSVDGRHKNGKAARRAFRAALEGVHCVIVWNSAAAIEAICAGVPAIALGPSAFTMVAGARLGQVEAPPRPDGREEWAAVLAANQWTFEEMRAGLVWRHMMEAPARHGAG